MSTIEDTRVYESRYQQIAVEMAEKIAEGWYEVGDRITSRSTIATTFHVSPETARKAMQVLVDMGIVTVKQAVNGSGVVVTVSSNSYGGALTAMVGIDNKGKITKVLVMSAQDTPGIGTKAQDPKHLEQYKGLNDLGSETIKDAKSKVKHITGASISSQAIHEAVFCGLKQYKAMGGAK